jgi:hypothetical protein
MSDIPSDTYTGSGEALILNSKCNKLIPFTSSYTWTLGGDGSKSFLANINYKNSIIGNRTFCAVYKYAYYPDSSNLFNYFNELGFDGSLNFNTSYFYDNITDLFFIIVSIYGKYKSCNYCSEEIDYSITTSASASTKEALKKKSGSIEQLHKLLDEKPALKKRYLEIMAKLGK